MGEKLTVNVVRQHKGFHFVLEPASRQRVEEVAGVAPAAANVFIGRDAKTAGDRLEIPAVEREVVGLLTGIEASTLLEAFEAIEFRRMPEGEVAHVLGESDDG